MGLVFVAEHLTLHKQVALKMVRSEYAGNRELLARFAREALAGAKIDHPSVVGALDYGTLEDGGAYLVMPLVRGDCLSDVLHARGRLPWPEAAELAAQIADALAAAWAQGFVHRDLKPDNVMLEPREQGGPLARVIDFGVAKLFDQLSGAAPSASAAGQPLTKEGTLIGTPGYMAPEQALGRAATHAADLYSLGVILWEALVGRRRWAGDSIQAIFRAQLKEQRPSAREASADSSIPIELDRLVEQLVAVRPEQRPQDARDVRDQLRAVVARHGAGRSLGAPKPRAAGQPNPTWRRRAWLVFPGMLGAGAVLGVLLALAPLERSPPDAAALSALLHDGSATARSAAARRLLKTGAELPPYAEHAARLELAPTCAEKKPELDALLRLGDERARSVLVRLANQPKTGCGPRENQDCLACLRPQLRQALSAAR